MCRWILYFGNEVPVADALHTCGHDTLTTCKHGLIHVARASVYAPGFDEEEQHDSDDEVMLNHKENGNGFGVGFYHANPDVKVPAVLRDCKPIWHSNNLGPIVNFVRSPLVFGHVRWGVSGSMAEQNCHPFTFGVYMFMHNGDIWKFHKIRSSVLALITETFDSVSKEHDMEKEIMGTTDSETFFFLILALIAKTTGSMDFTEVKCTRDQLVECVQEAIIHVLSFVTKINGIVGGGTLLNCALSDGQKVVITRFRNTHTQPPSLYFTFRNKDAKPHPSMIGKAKELQEGYKQGGLMSDNFGFTKNSLPKVVMIASEPTDKEHLWKLVPRNHLVTIERKREGGLHVQAQPLQIPEDVFQYYKGVWYI